MTLGGRWPDWGGALRACAAVVLACAVSGCSLVASKGDYRGYRAVRLAQEGPPRLRAMRAYLQAHPAGHWADEVDAQRRALDAQTFDTGKDSRAGLELYLLAFPDGTFATQARQRLAVVAAVEARRDRERALATQAKQAAQEQKAQLRRTWVSRFVGFWGGTFSALQGWGLPIADVAQRNPLFAQAFGRSPRPRCSEVECLKYYDAEYAIPVPGGTRVEGRMRLVLRLELRAGQLVAVELLLPARGFSRWSEHEQQRVVVDADPTQRREAVRWAIARLGGLIEGLGGGAELLGPRAPPEIAALGIAATGELIDTGVADPGAPPDRIAGVRPVEGTAPDAGEGGPTAGLGAPDAAPDLVLGGLQIGADGGAVELEVPETEPVAEPAGEVMVLDALAVPAEGEVQAAAPVAAAPPHQVPEGVVPRAVAYRVGKLEFLVFSSGNGAGPGFDGLRIRPLP